MWFMTWVACARQPIFGFFPEDSCVQGQAGAETHLEEPAKHWEEGERLFGKGTNVTKLSVAAASFGVILTRLGRDIAECCILACCNATHRDSLECVGKALTPRRNFLQKRTFG